MAGRLLAAGLLLFAVGLGGAVQAAATADAEAPEITRVRLTSHTLKVNWLAQTRDRGGQFLLLSGRDADSLEPVARVTVDHSGRYRLIDRVEFSGRFTYELRFVDSLGRERVLATRNVSVDVIEGHPSGEIAPGFSLPLGLAADLRLTPPALSPTSRVMADWNAAIRADSPPTPPPRSA